MNTGSILETLYCCRTFQPQQFCFHLLFFGAHPHQARAVLDVVVVVVFLGSCRLLPVLPQSVLRHLLLLDALLELSLEVSTFRV